MGPASRLHPAPPGDPICASCPGLDRRGLSRACSTGRGPASAFEDAVARSFQMAAHGRPGPLRIAVADRVEDRAVLVQHAGQARSRPHQRHAVELHADGDVLPQGLQRRHVVVVVRRLRDGEVEGEIGVLPVPMRARRVAHQLQGRGDRRQGGLVPAQGGVVGVIGLDRQPELVAALDVGDRLDRGIAQRVPLRRLRGLVPDEAAGSAPRIDQPVFAQASQGLPHDRARHQELRGQLVLARQLLVGLVLARADLGQQVLIDLLDQRGLAPAPRRVDFAGRGGVVFEGALFGHDIVSHMIARTAAGADFLLSAVSGRPDQPFSPFKGRLRGQMLSTCGLAVVAHAALNR